MAMTRNWKKYELALVLRRVNLLKYIDRIVEVENRLCFLEEEHQKQKANPAATADEIAALQQKLDDMENREQRKNLRFVGFP